MKYNIAIVGNKDVISGFRAVGVEAYPIERNDFKTIINHLIKNDGDKYAIIFVTEDIYDRNKSFLNELEAKALPAIVAVPSQAGSTGAGLKNLSKIVEQAVGSDILSND